MKSAVILALTSTTLAVPFGNVIDAIFGTTNEARHFPHPDHMPDFHPIGTGSGIGFPFPTASGAFPAASGGMHILPHVPGHRHYHKKSLAIDYQLAPTVVPKVGKRQEASGSSLPSFTLLDPSDTVGVPAVPTSTALPYVPLPTENPESPVFSSILPEEPSLALPTSGFPLPTGEPELPFPTGDFPLPTGGFSIPTDGFPLPTGVFPLSGTGIPGLPTTLQTLTRGPQPTAAPSYPGQYGSEGETESDDPQGWLGWLEGMFGGGGRSEMSP